MLKPGVRLLGIRPELVVAIIVARDIWSKHNAPFVITSCVDGTHTRASKHYTGCAVDLRTHGLTNPAGAVRDLQTALGLDFDVIHEGPGTPQEHIHLEWDPKDPV